MHTIDGSDKIKDKIRKLMNLANDSGAFDGEIDNALRFARRLMLEHNIDEKELGQPQDPIEAAAKTQYAQADAFTHGTDLSLWESVLKNAICDLIGTIGCYRAHGKVEKRNEAGMLQFDSHGKTMRSTKLCFYGPAEDVRDAAMLFHEWTHVISAMARLKFGGCFHGDGRSYAEGFTQGIQNTVDQIKREEKILISRPDTMNTSGALVVRNSTDLMTAKKNQATVWLRREAGITLRTTTRSANHNNPGAFGAGMNDGKKANFSRSKILKISA